MNILAKIEYLKEERGWTDYKLSLESGVPQSSIATMRQRNTPPKIEILEQLCDAFGISLAQFFCEDNDNMQILTHDEQQLIQSFRRLPQKRKQALLYFLDGK